MSKLVDKLASALLPLLLGPVASFLWNGAVNLFSRPDLVLPWQAGLVTGLAVLFGVLAVQRFPSLVTLVQRFWISLVYLARMLPVVVHEALARGEPGRGKHNQRYPSEAAFYAAKRRRATRD